MLLDLKLVNVSL